jgi:hypothetical protein
MTPIEIAQLSLVKSAVNRWTQMYKHVSPVAQEAIQSLLAPGRSKQIGKALGRGMEGRVFPSITQGIGDTVTKVFKPDPRFAAFSTPKAIAERFAIHEARPDILRKVHSYGDKHMVMEPLTPAPSKLVETFLRNLEEHHRLKGELRTGSKSTSVGSLLNRLKAKFGVKVPDNHVNAAHEMTQRFTASEAKRVGREAMRDPLYKLMTGKVWENKPPLLKDMAEFGGMFRREGISSVGVAKGQRLIDFGLLGTAHGGKPQLHNIMMRGNQPVISDFLVSTPKQLSGFGGSKV